MVFLINIFHRSRFKYFLIVLLLFNIVTSISAQQNDTIIQKKDIIAWKYNSTFTQREKVDLDTLHLQFYNYTPNARISDYRLDLGSFASPSFSLIFTPLEQSPSYLHPFRNSLYVAEDLLDYNTTQPFTDIFYSVSKSQEQQVKFFHTQNYNKDLNLGLQINYYKSLGEYTPQSVVGKHFAPWISYNGSRFSTFFKFAYNSILYDENGGILADTLINNKKTTTKLDKAQTQLVYQNAIFVQKWNLVNTSDYIDTVSIEIPQYPLALGFKMQYNASKKYYTDNNLQLPNYYQVLWDSLQTNDTTKHKIISNSIFLESNSKTLNFYRAINLGVGYEYENCYYRDYNYSYPEIHRNSLFYSGSFLFEYVPLNVLFQHNHKWYFYGNSQSDISFTTQIKKQFKIANNKTITINVEHEFEKAQPHCMYSDFMSNHEMWNLNLVNETRNHVFGKISSSWANISMSMHYYALQNYAYFNAIGSINQISSLGKAFVYDIKKQTNFWKFTMQNGCVAQYYTIKGINYPQWATYNSLSFHNVIYKKLIDFNIGIEGLYYPKYYVPQYNTSMGVYTMQYSSEIGAYPHVNAFVSVKYKPIRILLKYNGLYSELFEKNFTALHYPQQSGYFAFAVSWLFYN